ncbi:hypothetical protein G7Z17_g7503 [Cylindrodendrum hubeiense]|uniref:Uncharacterized protein n=1 Tax=Cylindrodendrum hubeiense TaxID=595255 RepID=A0A9P5L9V3_9HYPO|nr:hypothetical protein G7Z17_g7503 [Cylindrodendrum hubeiense]
MSGHEVPNNSMSQGNNRKRRYDGDEPTTGNASSDASKYPSKRRRVSLADNEDISTQDVPDTSSSPSHDISVDEDLSNIEVDLDDLESIPEEDVESIRRSFGDIDHTDEDVVIEAIGTANTRSDGAGDDQARPLHPQSDSGSVFGWPPRRQDIPQQASPYQERYVGGKDYLRRVMSDSDISDDEL